jgi:hypothetical protein
VDHHAHSVLRADPADLDEFRGLFSESPHRRQWPHIATSVTFNRAIALLASTLRCAPNERAVFERRLATVPFAYAGELMRAAGAEVLLVDEGYPPAEATVTTEELAVLAGCPARPILRIEGLPGKAAGGLTSASVKRVQAARDHGYVALKTIAAYRGGLDLDRLGAAGRKTLTTALEANQGTGDPLPVQVHTGFGDPDVQLPRARPGYLQPLLERYPDTNFVLLHCYPFVREAGWLASVYPNVFMDLSLTIPLVARPACALAEALELAPVSKLLYGSDAVRTPELYLLAAVWWRDALAEILPGLLGAEAAEAAARMILRENAVGLYRL